MYTIETASERILSKLDQDDIQLLYQILDSRNEITFLKIVCKYIGDKHPGLATQLFAQFEEVEEIINQQNLEDTNKEIFS